MSDHDTDADVRPVLAAGEFYDELASVYHLLFDDWWSAVVEHGRLVGAVLRASGHPRGRLLDCTCGIGTQALGLAAAGYDVTGCDVSAASVLRAVHEAEQRGLPLDFRVCDVRELRDHVVGTFDVVVSCDNALAHLLTDDDLTRALRQVRSCLREGGLLLVSLRDYDAARHTRPDGVPLTIRGVAPRRHASGQSWRWSSDAEHVDVELMTLSETSPGSWHGESRATRVRALLRSSLDEALAAAGFVDCAWHEPENTGYHQPLVVCRAG